MPTFAAGTEYPPVGTVLQLREDGELWSGKAVKIIHYPDSYSAHIEATWGKQNRTFVLLERLNITVIRPHPIEEFMNNPRPQDTPTVATPTPSPFAKLTFVDYNPKVKPGRVTEPNVRISSRRMTLNTGAVKVLMATLKPQIANKQCRVILQWNYDRGILCIRAALATDLHALLLTFGGKDGANNGWISLAGFYTQFSITPPTSPVVVNPQPFGNALYLEFAKAIKES